MGFAEGEFVQIAAPGPDNLELSCMILMVRHDGTQTRPGLKLASTSTELLNAHHEVGIAPVNLFVCKYSCCRFVSWPSDEGNEFPKLLISRLRKTRAARFPREPGRDPVSLLELT